jgi:DNA (cytosine-5)-methyltransferase 1
VPAPIGYNRLGKEAIGLEKDALTSRESSAASCGVGVCKGRVAERSPLGGASADRRRGLPLTAFALFAGAGGFGLGLEQAGVRVLLSTDIEPAAEATHRYNWPDRPFLCADVRKISGAQLIQLAGGIRPDIICGGPPCQGFSTLGDKLSADPRNNLFEAYASIVAEVRPRFVMLENVKAMVTMYGGQYKDRVLAAFSKLGYAMSWSVLNAADFGVPQIRHRVIFFGALGAEPCSLPNPTHGEGRRAQETVWAHIADLVKAGAEVQGHIALAHSDTVVRRYRLVPEGGRLPPPEQLPSDIRRLNFGNTYKRLHRKRPALTLVPGNNAFPIHPTLDRSLTPREAARLQTFPDSFHFVGDRRRQCILVGNAVPPLLARRLAERATEFLRQKPSAEPIRPRASVPSASVVVEEKSIHVVPLISTRQFQRTPASQGFVDLFSGAGGFTLGFARAGWRPLLSVDFNRWVAATHRHNYPELPFIEASLSETSVRDSIVDTLETSEVGVVVGGPPCQGFSIFGKRRFTNTRGYDPQSDPRNSLVYAFIDIVDRVQPRWFVMENVPGFANLDDGRFLNEVLAKLTRCGYSTIEHRILNAADYGVPQLRKRLLVIGNRTGHIVPWPKRKFFSEPAEWQEPHRTVGEAISDLATAESLSRHTCHVPMNHKPLLVERYKYIPEGGKLDVLSLPAKLRSGYRTDEVKNYSHVFKRLHRARPAGTVVPGHNALPIHPWLNRALTVREAARLQTFPDSLEFMGPRQEQCIQVGNAFPPLLAELLANNIRKAERNNWRPGSVGRSAYYALVETS